jgi:hypothetical protein
MGNTGKDIHDARFGTGNPEGLIEIDNVHICSFMSTDRPSQVESHFPVLFHLLRKDCSHCNLGEETPGLLLERSFRHFSAVEYLVPPFGIVLHFNSATSEPD